ncbi:MAG: dipicolinate synthase subunit DpsA [Clostridia bacterium]|nr:dipicolinate synthase subunit DpsA [Clostridia bacterium]
MNSKLQGMKIAILGGDRRQLILIDQLVRLGAIIQVIGLPTDPDTRIRECATVAEAVTGADVVILPMPGTNDEGKIHAVFSKIPLLLTPEIMDRIPQEVPILVGAAKPYLKNLVAARSREMIEIAEIDDVAILNSIPSAEGAIQLAMEESLITIHGSNSFVLGFGRCGITLARMLCGLGAKVTAVARKSADLARIYEAGYEACTFGEMEDLIQEADFIFNTVPAPVLPAGLLKKVKPEVVIVDIASTPGGTDFKAAANLGLKAILAPGLPGKVAPKTAGDILARVVPDLITTALGLN